MSKHIFEEIFDDSFDSDELDEELIYGLYLNGQEKPIFVGNKAEVEEKKAHLAETSSNNDVLTVKKIGKTSWEGLEESSELAESYNEQEYNRAKDYFINLSNKLFDKYDGATVGYFDELDETVKLVLKDKPEEWQIAWKDFSDVDDGDFDESLEEDINPDDEMLDEEILDKKTSVAAQKGLTESIITNLYDEDEIKDTKEELNKEEEEPVEEIVDVNANVEADVAKDHIGQCVLECSKCHGLRYINKEDLKLDPELSTEELNVYNTEDECPTCHANDGWTLGGMISKINNDEEYSEEDAFDWDSLDDYNGPEVPEEESTEEEVFEEEPAAEEEFHESFDLKEADEKTFEEHINKYLRETYHNVENYTINNIIYNEDKKLILEGILTYISGKRVDSNFELSVDNSKDHILLEGCNKTISDKDTAFTFVCENIGDKLTANELNYNYMVEDIEVSGCTKINKDKLFENKD